MLSHDTITFHPTEEAARNMAETMLGKDSDWSYKIKKENKGWVVTLFDEDGYRLGTI